MAPRSFKLVAGWLPPDFDASGGGHILDTGSEIKPDGSGGPSPTIVTMTLSPQGTQAMPNRQLKVLLTLRFWGPDVPNQRLDLTATDGASRLSVPDPRYGFEERTLGDRTVILREAEDRWAAWNEDDVHCSVHSKGVSRTDLRRFIAELVRVEPVEEPQA